MLAGALFLGLHSSVVPETHISAMEKQSDIKVEKKKSEGVPFVEEVSCCVHQQEHLLLGSAAVAGVEVMLQRDRPLHGADHINVLLLYTTRNGKG